MSLWHKVGRQVTEIGRPRILSTRKFKGQEPQIFESTDVFGDDQLAISVSILPDDVAPLSQRVQPQLVPFDNVVLTSAIDGLLAQSGLPLTSSISSNFLSIAEEYQISKDILSVIRQRSPSAGTPRNAIVELLHATEVVDPFAPDRHLFLEFPEVVTFSYPVIPFVRVMGMNYRDRIWKDITPEYEQLPLIEESTDNRTKRKPKPKSASEENGGSQPQKSEKPNDDFWDDIFLLLQPPIILDDTVAASLPYPLYSFQPRGVCFLTDNHGALLADEMGTGKTVMTTVALRILCRQGEVKRALILCPVSVLREWERHLREWAPELWVTFVRGTQRERELKWKMRTNVYVTTYSTFRNDLQRGVLPAKGMETFDAVILDEAQYIKNPKSGRSRAVKELQAKYRWALSGTPVENKLDDLISIFDFLHPGYLQPEDSEPKQVRAKITPYFLRRRKIDVLPDLPPKQRQDFWLRLNRRQRESYEQIKAQVESEFTTLGNRVTKVHIFSAITRLKQICNFAPGKYTSPKVQLLKEQIEEIVDNEQKVIVFTQFIDEGLAKLQKALSMYGVAIIRGGQSDRQRASQIARFKNTPAHEVPILLATVKSAGVGLNLKEATYVIHFDHWWNPAIMWQAEDRAHRADQTHGVNVYSYWVEDTIEERIFNILEQKNLLFQSVVGELAEDQIESRISDKEWLDIVLGVRDKTRTDRDNSGVSRPMVREATSSKAAPEVTDDQGTSIPTVKRTAARVRKSPASQPNIRDIRQALLDLTPKAFELLTADLFRRLGYPHVRVTGGTADGGVDVIAIRYTSEGREEVAVQCKRYEHNVGVRIARELLGVVSHPNATFNRGFLVTTSKLTNACQRFCDSEELLQAISGPEVARYIKDYQLDLEEYSDL